MRRVYYIGSATSECAGLIGRRGHIVENPCIRDRHKFLNVDVVSCRERAADFLRFLDENGSCQILVLEMRRYARRRDRYHCPLQEASRRGEPTHCRDVSPFFQALWCRGLEFYSDLSIVTGITDSNCVPRLRAIFTRRCFTVVFPIKSTLQTPWCAVSQRGWYVRRAVEMKKRSSPDFIDWQKFVFLSVRSYLSLQFS